MQFGSLDSPLFLSRTCECVEKPREKLPIRQVSRAFFAEFLVRWGSCKPPRLPCYVFLVLSRVIHVLLTCISPFGRLICVCAKNFRVQKKRIAHAINLQLPAHGLNARIMIGRGFQDGDQGSRIGNFTSKKSWIAGNIRKDNDAKQSQTDATISRRWINTFAGEVGRSPRVSRGVLATHSPYTGPQSLHLTPAIAL